MTRSHAVLITVLALARRHCRTRPVAVLGTIIASSAIVASAAAATLSVKVVPRSVTEGATYDVIIAGTFTRTEVSRRPYLIALIQFAPDACKTSAQREVDWARKTNNPPEWYLAPPSHPDAVGVFENTSPFTRTNSFTASSSGTRHICAYLYPRFVPGPNDPIAPIARADGRYTVTDPPTCHFPFTLPRGYGSNKVAYDAVTIIRHAFISCDDAMHIAAKAYALPHLKPIHGPQFGGGGFGGPFRVGSFHCWLLNRGSDFRNATCHRGRQTLRFYDHRQLWSEHDPAFPPPALTP